MIKGVVTLILGAGASMPYGFPSGAGLKGEICATFLRGITQGPIDLLMEAGFKQEDIWKFTDSLQLSGKTSIDAFLERRSEFVEIGKYAIAYILIGAENLSPLTIGGAINDHWYEYFLNKVDAPWEEMRQNKINILTFNYDRSLERYLLLTLMHSFGKSEGECRELIRSFNIIHLHGKLGSLIENENYRPYPSQLNLANVKNAANGIKIIHETTNDSPEFVSAREILRTSETICILGFGYHNKNLERLGFMGSNRYSIKRAYGSLYGFTENESVQIIGKFQSVNIMLIGSDAKNLAFLRNFPVLLS